MMRLRQKREFRKIRLSLVHLQVDNCKHTLEVHHCTLDDEGEYTLTVNNKKTDATLVVERE